MRFPARSTTARGSPQPGTAGGPAAPGLPPRLRLLLAGAAAAALAAVAATVIALAGSGVAAQWAGNLAWTFAGVAALCGPLAAGLALPPHSAVRGSWLLYAAAAVCWLTGALIRDIRGPGTLSPEAAYFWIGFAAICIASFYRRLPRPVIFLVMLLDALPVVLLVVGIVHVLYPPPAGIRTLYAVLVILYPAVFGLLAANAVQMLGIHRDLRRVPASVWLFTAGFLLMALAALLWAPAALATHAAQGHLVDLLWTLGLLGVASSGVMRALTPSGYLELPPRERQSGPHALPPAAAMLGLLIMLAVAPVTDRVVLGPFLLISSVALFIRVFLMRREDMQLFADLARSQRQAETAAERERVSAGRLHLLADVTARLSSLQLGELMQSICDTARQVAGARYGAFGLPAAGGPQFANFVASGMGEEAKEPMARLPEGAELMQSLLRAGRPVRIADMSGQPGAKVFPAGHPATGSFLGVPVPVAPGRAGGLYLIGKAGGFTEEDEMLVSLLAANAGHAVANAELFGESQAQRAQLAERNEQLRVLDQMKDEFIALVSHELRTPLTSIIGYLELLEDEAGELPPTHRQFVGKMHRNAQRLLRLVGDLLFLAGLQSGRLTIQEQEVDLSALARARAGDSRTQAGSRDVEVTFVAAVDPVPVLGDEDRLIQLVDNLLSNAIKFTPAGGQVVVTVGTEGDQALIEVTDTGIGITAEDQAHVFERFFRTETATAQAIPGPGIGLTICKAIVEAHGGKIGIASEPGAGTTVRAWLPLRERQRQQSGAAGRSLPGR